MSKIYLALGFAVFVLFAPVGLTEQHKDLSCEIEPQQIENPELLTHAQEIWISALEWCESRGRPEAVNPLDRDGTPSYYSYQFKPSTFRTLGETYGVISKGRSHDEIMELIKDTSLQRAIVRGMIKDTTTVWEQQFPGCVRKIGRPPQY